MDYSQFGAMVPELIILGLFLVVFLFDTFSGEGGKKILTPLTAVLFGIATVAIWLVPTNGEVSAFGGMYVDNAACKGIKAILNVGVFLVILQSAKWVGNEYTAIRKGEFFELMLVTLFGMYLMVSARHFLLFIIGLESASLPLAALVAFNKKEYESTEAAVKYILTAVFSSAILLMGLSFVYAFSGGSLYFNDIMASIAGGNSLLLIIAVAFVLAGMGFKLSLVPFHLWTADVYEGAPTAVTSYLSVISKGAAAFAFFTVFMNAFGTVYEGIWQLMLYIVIIATITIGNLFAIRQRNMKRFMAFSSISQAGYIMLGVFGAQMGLASIMFYIFVYIVSNLGVFAVISTIENNSGKLSMDDYVGLHKSNPWLAFAMTLAMFSLAGIPPFAGFFSKFLIFTSVAKTGSIALYVLVLIALINTIISLYYYLLVVKAMWITPGDAVIGTFKSDCPTRIALWICVAGIVFMGLVPCIYEYCYNAAMAFPI